MSTTVFKWIVIGVGLVVAGEAFALAFGVGLLSRKGRNWLTGKNFLLLALDILAGGVLIWAAFGIGVGGVNRLMFYGSLIILLISHTYRTWEYLAHRSNPFCFNLPLFIVNEVKSTSLLVVLVLILVRAL